MITQWNMFALSGVSSILALLGGKNEKFLKINEKYMVTANKCISMPPLNEARINAPGVLLQSLTTFCFSGSHGNKY